MERRWGCAPRATRFLGGACGCSFGSSPFAFRRLFLVCFVLPIEDARSRILAELGSHAEKSSARDKFIQSLLRVRLKREMKTRAKNWQRVIIEQLAYYARVAELADAPDLGSGG